MKNIKKKGFTVIMAIVLAVAGIGLSYAFFYYYQLGNNNHLLLTGEVYLTLTETDDILNLNNMFPETAVEARDRTDNVITFTISGLNTTSDKDIYYEIILNEGTTIQEKSRFNPSDLRFDLIEINGDTETYVVSNQSYDDINERRIWVNTINRNTTTDLVRTYKLRMWLAEDVLISDTNVNADYSTDVFKNSYASIKIAVSADFNYKALDTETTN